MITALFAHSARFTRWLLAVLAELVSQCRRHCVLWQAGRSCGGGGIVGGVVVRSSPDANLPFSAYDECHSRYITPQSTLYVASELREKRQTQAR